MKMWTDVFTALFKNGLYSEISMKFDNALKKEAYTVIDTLAVCTWSNP